MNNKVLFEQELAFCKVSIFDSYIYVIMKEGITVIPDYNEILNDLAKRYFLNKKFVYITHRIHSYSVDPTIYLETAKIENLIGFAVVSKEDMDSPINRDKIKVEKLFFQKPFESFENLDSALKWKNQLLLTAN